MWCMCVDACPYKCMFVCGWLYVYIRIYDVYMWVCVYMFVCGLLHICMCIYVYMMCTCGVCVYIGVCVFKCVNTIVCLYVVDWMTVCGNCMTTYMYGIYNVVCVCVCTCTCICTRDLCICTCDMCMWYVYMWFVYMYTWFVYMYMWFVYSMYMWYVYMYMWSVICVHAHILTCTHLQNIKLFCYFSDRINYQLLCLTKKHFIITIHFITSFWKLRERERLGI